MIADGRPYLQYAAWIALVPGIALTAFTLSFAFVGDGLRDAFDVKEGGPAK
jgi:peptide/nickel transport system permease protein